MLLEFKKVLVQERTLLSLNATREKGRKGGRTRKMQKEQKYYLKHLYDSKNIQLQYLLE